MIPFFLLPLAMLLFVVLLVLVSVSTATAVVSLLFVSFLPFPIATSQVHLLVIDEASDWEL